MVSLFSLAWQKGGLWFGLAIEPTFPAFPAFDRYPVLVSVLLFHSRCPGAGWVVFLAVCLAAMGGKAHWARERSCWCCSTLAPHRPGESNVHKENLPKGKEKLIPTPCVAPKAD